MRLTLKTSLPLTIFWCFVQISFAQGVHSTRFNFSDYNGGHENWDFCSIGKNLAVANEQGILVYENGIWQSAVVNPEISPKALIYHNSKLYTSYGNRIGYYKTQADTVIGNFIPLKLPVELEVFHQIWKIVKKGNTLYFQTDQHVLQIENDKLVKVLPYKGFVRCIFEINGDIYFIDDQQGLLKNFKPMSTSSKFAGKEINVILPFSKNSILVINNTDNEINIVTDSNIVSFNNTKLFEDYPFCGTANKGRLYIGTIDNGIYEIDKNGQTIEIYNKSNILGYNKVFNLFFDKNELLWVGLENGIECFRFDMPFTNLGFDGKNGNAINITTVDSLTYFMTSTGIYYQRTDKLFNINTKNDLKLWNNVIVPSYFIRKIENSLVYGNLLGLFVYSNGQTKKLDVGRGCKKFMKINDQFITFFVQNRWVLFSIQAGNLIYERELDLPDNFQVIEGKIIWHFGKNLMQQEFDYQMNMGKVTSFETDEVINRLFVKNDTIFLTNSDGTYIIKSTKGKKVLMDKYSSESIVKIDGFKTDISFPILRISTFFDSNQKNKLQISAFIKSMIEINKDKVSFLKQINDTLICVGTFRGFSFINTKLINSFNDKQFTINNIVFKSKESTLNLPQLTDNEIHSPFKSLTVNIGLLRHYFPENPLFRLVVNKDGKISTTNWTKATSITFDDLDVGDYHLSIECKDWFGNIKTLDIGEFKLIKEHPFLMALKILILLVILAFLAIALRNIFRKSTFRNIELD